MTYAGIPFELDADHRRYIVGNEPMAFHCHHFNTYLLRTILDAADFDSAPVLRGAAAEVAYAQLPRLFKQIGVRSVPQRKGVAQELYRWAGFGTFDLSGLTAQGGTVRTSNSHYGHGWRAKFGKAAHPVCYFDAGWLAGALAAIYDRPNGSYLVEQQACIGMGARENVFDIELGSPNYKLYTSVGVGSLTTHRVRDVPPSGVDYAVVFEGVTKMDLGGNEEGHIPAFGVYLTRHYSNYCNRIAFEMLRSTTSKFGDEGYQAAAALLTEAGHACAFHTLGGVMVSPEWDALVRPMLKTHEDWVHGIVAVMNALGWGRWQVTKVSRHESEFVIHDDSESVGYNAMYGKAERPVTFLHAGAVAGLMNLIYLGNVAAGPELNDEYYNRLFKQTSGYRAEVKACKAMGDEVTVFRVARG